MAIKVLRENTSPKANKEILDVNVPYIPIFYCNINLLFNFFLICLTKNKRTLLPNVTKCLFHLRICVTFSVCSSKTVEYLKGLDVHLSTGGVCDGGCIKPICLPFVGYLFDINRSAGYSAHAVRVLIGLCQREQRPHRLSVPSQLVCTDC